MAMTAFERAAKRYAGETGRIDDPIRFIVNPPHGVFMQTVLVRADTMREAGDFDPRFRVSQDTDFLFRLALVAKFCFVNRALVEIDRTETRSEGLTTHAGRSTLTRLETYRLMFGLWQERVAPLDPDIRRSVRRLGRSILSEQASWYLSRGETAEARARLAKLLSGGFSARAAAKWLLIAIAPGVAKRLLVRR
jgi:hypothetical protein